MHPNVFQNTETAVGLKYHSLEVNYICIGYSYNVYFKIAKGYNLTPSAVSVSFLNFTIKDLILA